LTTDKALALARECGALTITTTLDGALSCSFEKNGLIQFFRRAQNEALEGAIQACKDHLHSNPRTVSCVSTNVGIWRCIGILEGRSNALKHAEPEEG